MKKKKRISGFVYRRISKKISKRFKTSYKTPKGYYYVLRKKKISISNKWLVTFHIDYAETGHELNVKGNIYVKANSKEGAFQGLLEHLQSEGFNFLDFFGEDTGLVDALVWDAHPVKSLGEGVLKWKHKDSWTQQKLSSWI